jgi:cytochrome P450
LTHFRQLAGCAEGSNEEKPNSPNGASLGDSPSVNTPNDPFAEARRKSGVLRCPFQGESIPMMLRHADVQRAAKDWQTFSSDTPFRVPIPSEENLRTMRQLPIETNPPQHSEWRAIVEPFFKRSRDLQVVAKVEGLIADLLDAAIGRESLEIVEEFALPLQCHALTWLLNVPSSEAETWIDWGMHVFVKDGGEAGAMDTKLEDYLNARFGEADARNGVGDDFYTVLTRATYQGRALTRDEMMGFANLAFAGGRDTVIHTISSIFAHFAEHPQALEFLREDPKKRLAKAGEEFFRVVSPLTHIGRVCPQATEVLGEKVEADERVSLSWSSANHDEEVFENSHEVRLDRKPNPHIAFGAGAHFCLGAGHARMLVKVLLQALCDRVGAVTVLEAVPHVEQEAEFRREVGFDSLTVRVSGR